MSFAVYHKLEHDDIMPINNNNVASNMFWRLVECIGAQGVTFLVSIVHSRLGRLKKNTTTDKSIEYRDNYADRVEVKRAFALAKHSYGLGRIVTKLEEAMRGSISLSVVAMNIDKIVVVLLRRIFYSVFSMYNWQIKLPIFIQISF